MYGVLSQGALTVTGCEVRTSQATAMHGLGCYVSSIGAARLPSLHVERSFVHHVDVIGLVALSADVTIARSVIADTQPSPTDDRGWAILASDQDGPPTTMNVSQTVLARNADSNVRIFGSNVSLDAMTIEDSVANAEGYGAGLSIENGVADPTATGEATITRSVIRDTVRLAIEAYQGALTADELLVQRVTPSPGGDGRSRGLFAGWSNEGTGASAVLLERSIIEQTTKEGVVVLGSTAVLRDSIVRDVTGANDGELAVGVSVGPDPDSPTTPSDVLVERSTVASAAGAGILTVASNVVLRDAVLSDHDVVVVDGVSGVALFAAHDERKTPGTVEVTRCLVDDNGSRGIVSQAGGITIAETLVAGTRAEDPTRIGDGRGIEVQGGTASVVASEIADVSSVGLFVASADAEIAGLFVHDVDVDDLGLEGYGLVVASPFEGTVTVSATGSRVERVRTVGMLTDDSSVAIEGTVVTKVTGNAEGRFGRGIVGQGEEGWLRVANGLVEDTAEGGISLLESAGEIVDTTIRQVRAADDDGLFGDGILLIATGEALVRGCHVEQVARAAVSGFASVATLADNDLRCNDLPLASEPLEGVSSQLQDAGGNLCGCGEPATCKAVSAGLAPPEALPPTMQGPER